MFIRHQNNEDVMVQLASQVDREILTDNTINCWDDCNDSDEIDMISMGFGLAEDAKGAPVHAVLTAGKPKESKPLLPGDADPMDDLDIIDDEEDGKVSYLWCFFIGDDASVMAQIKQLGTPPAKDSPTDIANRM